MKPKPTFKTVLTTWSFATGGLMSAGLAAASCIATVPCASELVPVESPNAEDAHVTRLSAVTALAPDDIWAVGLYRTCVGCGQFDDDSEFALTMHFDGDTWTIVETPMPTNPLGETRVSLADVDARSANDVYAAGSAAINSIEGRDGFALRWDGRSWQSIATSVQAGNLYEAVHCLSNGDVMFGGQARTGPSNSDDPVVVRWTGSSATADFLPRHPSVTTGAHRIRAIASTGANNVWAVGGAGGATSAIGRAYAAHFDGSSWTRVPIPECGFDEVLHDVVVIATDDVWVSGSCQENDPESGQLTTVPLMLNWNGASWDRYESPAFAHAMLLRGPGDIFGVEGNDLIHWDGTAWSLIDSLVPEPTSGFINIQGVAQVGERCDLISVGVTSFSPSDNNSLIVRIAGDANTVGDVDGDGDVDVADLIALLTAWGPCGGCPADVDGDGVVGTTDLIALLASWS